MALPNIGSPISLNDVAAEFGGVAPHSMSEYGPEVGITAGNPVSLSDFYGASAASYQGQTGVYSQASTSLSLNPALAGASTGSFCLWAIAFNQISNYYTGTPSGWTVRNNHTSQLLSVLTTNSWDGAGETVGILSSATQHSSMLVAYSGYTWAVSGTPSAVASTVTVPGVTMPSAGIAILVLVSSGSLSYPLGGPSGWAYLNSYGTSGFGSSVEPKTYIFVKDVSAGTVANATWTGDYNPSQGLMFGIIPG